MIKISISQNGYHEKPQKNEFGKIVYETKTIELEEMLNLISNGYVFSANFRLNKDGTFTQKNRRYDNFISSQFVMIDMDDDIDLSLDDLVKSLKFKPTFAYTTFNHGIKGNRYRLMYFFNEEIRNIEYLKCFYKSILHLNNLKLNDNCGCNPTQCVIGSNEKCNLLYNNILYNIKDFIKYKDLNINSNRYKDETNEEKCKSDYIRKEETRTNIEPDLHFLDEEFKNDFYELRYEDLLKKYLIKYPYFDHTPLTIDEEKPYIILPTNYLEIKRYWLYGTIVDDKGNTKYYKKYARKIKDGNRRKYKLFINCILRRFMMPTISFEHLLINLIYEFFYYIDNTNDPISRQTLYNIAKNAYIADLAKYSKLGVKSDKRKFIVNQDYCIRYELSKTQVANISRKMMLYEAIGQLYDVSMTDRENLKVLEENDVKVCLRTLKNFKRDCGLTKVREKRPSEECNFSGRDFFEIVATSEQWGVAS